ncbi:uncharacterized protein HMPREF1541_06295 [Cyphellophora europaea CBS 101466]|uniref:Uncharacterized protein n=1 Tax=Cyphellophora europaea (strain CBS 101466) TaxID=1220924 RepID=W2RRA4_CYPE1|nr:uncharacterized protein HMPREF1541_06295 [Cyphellophora europaea CBS 101466]ETN38264.1 hypothetical protein HMPREF1541_06295 [Cyphellophora europaea CBS 101466]
MADFIDTLFSSSLQSRSGTANCSATDPYLPTDWTCPANDDVCISLFNSTSAYCCPAHANCNRIDPISCDKIAQDPAINPNTRIFLLRQKSILEECGPGCCPRGYHCLRPDINFTPKFLCRIYGDYAITPKNESASEATLAMPSSTPSSTALLILPSSSGTSHNDTETAGRNPGLFDSRTTVVVGATLAAAVGIIAAVLVAMIYLRYVRREAQAERDRKGRRVGSETELHQWSYDGLRKVPPSSSSKRSSDTVVE